MRWDTLATVAESVGFTTPYLTCAAPVSVVKDEYNEMLSQFLLPFTFTVASRILCVSLLEYSAPWLPAFLAECLWGWLSFSLCGWLSFVCVDGCRLSVWMAVVCLCGWLSFVCVDGCGLSVWMAVVCRCGWLSFVCVDGCRLSVWMAVVCLCGWLSFVGVDG